MSNVKKIQQAFKEYASINTKYQSTIVQATKLNADLLKTKEKLDTLVEGFKSKAKNPRILAIADELTTTVADDLKLYPMPSVIMSAAATKVASSYATSLGKNVSATEKLIVKEATAAKKVEAEKKAAEKKAAADAKKAEAAQKKAQAQAEKMAAKQKAQDKVKKALDLSKKSKVKEQSAKAPAKVTKKPKAEKKETPATAEVTTESTVKVEATPEKIPSVDELLGTPPATA